MIFTVGNFNNKIKPAWYMKYCLPIFFAAFLLIACNKSGDPDPAAPASSFTWTHAGVTYTASLDSAYEHSIALAPYYIVAINGTHFITNYTRKIDFSLTSFNPGAYTIVQGGPNRLNYINDAGFNFDGIAGTLNITSNVNNLLSGNFSATLVGPGPANSPVSGSFSNVSIRP
jgi:hypothetical protein